jgi:hypothetical protein
MCMVVWLLTGIGLDDWIYYHLVQSLVITVNYSNNQSLAEPFILNPKFMSKGDSVYCLFAIRMCAHVCESGKINKK